MTQRAIVSSVSGNKGGGDGYGCARCIPLQLAKVVRRELLSTSMDGTCALSLSANLRCGPCCILVSRLVCFGKTQEDVFCGKIKYNYNVMIYCFRAMSRHKKENCV